MKLIFKNINSSPLEVNIEPSTDAFVLDSGDVLELSPKFEGNLDYEMHLNGARLIIWIPPGQSFMPYINGKKIAGFCEDFVW